MPVLRRELPPSLLALCLIVTLAAPGCFRSTSCPSVRPRFETTLKAQRSALNDPKATSRVVAGVLVPEALIQRAVDAKFSEAQKKHTLLKQSLLGATFSLGGRWMDVEVDTGARCEGCLRVAAQSVLEARIGRGPLSIFSQKARARATFDLPIALAADPDGTSRLIVDPAGARDLAVKIDLPGLPEGFRDAADALATRSAKVALDAFASEPIRVVSWKPVALPETGITLKATRLDVLRDRKAVWIGWSANLAIDALTDDLPPPEGDPGPDAALVSIAAPALTHLTRAAALAGALPTRLNAELKPDPEGTIHVTIDEVTPRDDATLATTFTVWQLDEEEGCFEARFRADAAVALKRPKIKFADGRGNTLDLSLSHVEYLGSTGDDMWLRLALWWDSDFLQQTLTTQKDLIGAQRLDLGGGQALGVALRELRLGARRLDVKLGVTPAPAKSDTP